MNGFCISRQQVREVDRRAIGQLGIPGIVLMENASRNAAAVVLELLHHDLHVPLRQARVAILCGGGNNGGDGYAMARHLHNAGVAVALFAAKPPDQLPSDAAVNARIAQKMGLSLHPAVSDEEVERYAGQWRAAHVLVDALLGTGFSGVVRPPLDGLIEKVNQLAGPRVVAVDVPSGLDCDTGTAAAMAIKAHVTVTFVATKTGFRRPEAGRWLGRVVVADIGVPPELVQAIVGGD